jgi:NTE family protein
MWSAASASVEPRATQPAVIRRRAGLQICLLLGIVWLATWPAYGQTSRPRVGVAFGGGSARGIAHVGIIRWFEEHRIPIDVSAGTSMGGLVGGAFASGMSAAELRALIENTDWDVMFGSSSFPFKNIRRKEDARSYPARLEFGLKRGIVPPVSLNNGQQVDLLLARIAAPYHELSTFDELPTPFRTVAVDLRTAERVVIDRGSLAQAMRATMSLPAIFPPVEIGTRVLVDGGALDNVPADVVREMGAAVVIAVDVGYAPSQSIDYSMFGLMGQTVDSMMRANTRRALESADFTIAIDVAGFGSLDWRRSAELMDRGYEAAERARDRLLPLQLSEADWQVWLEDRASRRRKTLAVPTFIATAGIAPTDAAAVRRALERHMNQQIQLDALEDDLEALSGMDRYQAIGWQMLGAGGREGLLVRAREKPYAPPFLMLGVNLTNTTSSDFRVQLAGRYLSYDVVGFGSELRIDAVVGSDPSAAVALYRPLWTTPLFVRPYAGVGRRTIDIVAEDVVIAEYREERALAGADVGVNLSRISELTTGLRSGRVSATIRAGDPRLPELSGGETLWTSHWAYDSQDSPIVPSEGTRAFVALIHYLQSPELAGVDRTNDRVTQLEGGASSVWTWRRRNRLFAVVSGGTSFDGKPISQFTLGSPFRLDAFNVGERRGDHYAVVTAGLLRQIGRLPDFMGGPMFAGAWLQNGSAFDTSEDADINSHLGLGIVLDSLIGPFIAGVGVGLDGGWRTYLGIGRVF